LLFLIPHKNLCTCAELIGEEIYDEFDSEGARGEPLHVHHHAVAATPATATVAPSPMLGTLANVRNLHFFRSLSAPPIKRDPLPEKDTVETSTEPADTGNGPLPNTATPPAPEVVVPTTIEAKLLDHKRRRIMSSTQTGVVAGTEGKVIVSGVPVRPRPGPKGKFKSGPIKKSAIMTKLEPTASAGIPEIRIESPTATTTASASNVPEQGETGER
jgi:metal transporter CNNM